MYFYDINPSQLPLAAQYYYNILIVCIALNPKYLQNPELQEWWDIDEITEPRPKATHVYLDPDMDEDIQYEIQCYPHSVLEIDPKHGISWYDMTQFDKKGVWEID